MDDLHKQSGERPSRPTDGRVEGQDTAKEYLGRNAAGSRIMEADETYRQQYEADAVRELFSYHPPRPDQIPKYQAIRTAAKRFAEDILANVPAGCDRTAAIDMLRDSVMLANSAIALDGRSWSF